MGIRNLSAVLALSAALAASAAPAAALEVRLAIPEDAGVERKPGTVTGGVPFAKGTVKDLARLSVAAGDRALPAQFEKLAVWEDGSVRWALLDCQADVPAGGRAELVLRDDGRNPAPAAPVKVADGDAEVKLLTGTLEVVIPKKQPGLLSVRLDGRERLGAPGRGLVLAAVGEAKEVEKKVGNRTVKVTEYGPGGEVVAEAPAEVRVEQAGPLRAAVLVRGKFPGVHDGLLGYSARISVFAGQKFVKVHLWIENRGGMGYPVTDKRSPPHTPKMEWLHFDGLCVELGAAGATAAACEGAEADGRLKLFQTCRMAKGGRKVDRASPEVFTMQDFEYVITGGADGKELKKGERTDGVVEVRCGEDRLVAAVRDFWQNYDKGLELDAGKLRLWLWPTEGQWPREGGGWEGLGDAQLQKVPRPGLHCLPGSVHKGHEFILDLSGRPAASTSAELSRPLFALAAAEHCAATEAAPALFAPPGAKTGDSDCDAKLAARDAMVQSLADPEGPGGFVAARRAPDRTGAGYWYGWMDFGDACMTGHGPMGLHPDWLFVTMLGALRSGDVRLLRLGTEMGRHRIDVDQFWSDRDPPHCTRLQRGNANFPALHCNRLSTPPGLGTNHLAGTVLYYLLTGERKALECAERNAEGLKAAWEHAAKVRAWAGPQSDMTTNGYSMHGYCAMYALTGDRVWLDRALGLFRGHVVPKWKAAGSHLHDRGQIYKQDYTQDDIRYCYALMPLCLLHRYTGDAQLLDLLRVGAEKDFPPNFFDAPMFLADIAAYVAMETGSVKLAERAREHWLQAFPEGKCPPVWLPNNVTWGVGTGMHLRAGHVLGYYYWQKGRGALPAGKPPAPLPGSDTPPAVFPAGDGPLVLEAEDFCRERAEVKNMEGAGGGKTVLFEYFDGRATRAVKLAAGTYRLTARMYAPDSDSDALVVTLAGSQPERMIANGTKRLVDSNPVTVTLAADGVHQLVIEPAETDFQLDSVEIVRVKSP